MLYALCSMLYYLSSLKLKFSNNAFDINIEVIDPKIIPNIMASPNSRNMTPPNKYKPSMHKIVVDDVIIVRDNISLTDKSITCDIGIL